MVFHDALVKSEKVAEGVQQLCTLVHALLTLVVVALVAPVKVLLHLQLFHTTLSARQLTILTKNVAMVYFQGMVLLTLGISLIKIDSMLPFDCL